MITLIGITVLIRNYFSIIYPPYSLALIYLTISLLSMYNNIWKKKTLFWLDYYFQKILLYSLTWLVFVTRSTISVEIYNAIDWPERLSGLVWWRNNLYVSKDRIQRQERNLSNLSIFKVGLAKHFRDNFRRNRPLYYCFTGCFLCGI